MGKAIVIDEKDVVVSRRGRKAAGFDTDLLDDLKTLKAGKALDLSPYFGEVTEKAERATVGQTIRRHWKAVRSDAMRLDFGANKPQVRVKK